MAYKSNTQQHGKEITVNLKQVAFRPENNNICPCGRQTHDAHCPKCGSVSKWGKVSNSEITQVDHVSMTYAIAPGYKCRRCGEDYNVLDECFAPKVEAKRQRENLNAQRLGRRRVEFIDPSVLDSQKLPAGKIDTQLLDKLIKTFGPPSENADPKTPEEELAMEIGDGICHCGADYTDGGKVCMRCGKERKIASPSENKKL